MNSDEIEFEIYLRQQLELELKNVTKEAEKVLKEKVQKNLYDAYDPVSYTRTGDLKDSITSKCTNTEGQIYFDESKLGHEDCYGNNTKLVPQYTNYGHTDDTGIDNMYHNYPSRNFMEDTVTEMESDSNYDMFNFKIVNN